MDSSWLLVIVVVAVWLALSRLVPGGG